MNTREEIRQHLLELPGDGVSRYIRWLALLDEETTAPYLLAELLDGPRSLEGLIDGQVERLVEGGWTKRRAREFAPWLVLHNLGGDSAYFIEFDGTTVRLLAEDPRVAVEVYNLLLPEEME